MPRIELPNAQPDLDEAKYRYLRTFADVYFPQLADLALSQHNDAAISLLIFSARPELQTPKPTEDGLPDYWQAMLDIAPLVTVPPPGEASASASG